MPDPEEPIRFTICGQNFRLRGTGEDARRAHRVAERVDTLIRGYKEGTANSELRAAVMAAYELAHELDGIDALRQQLEQAARERERTAEERERQCSGALEKAQGALDRLLEQLDGILPDPNARPERGPQGDLFDENDSENP